MKFFCSKKLFSKFFFAASSVAAVRDVKAVFQNVKLTANTEDNTLVFMATNFDVSIRLTLSDEKTNISEGGSIILPTKLLSEILSVCNDEYFYLSTDGNNVSFFDGRYTNIPTIPAEEFHDIEYKEFEKYNVSSPHAFINMFNRTLFATSDENVKYALGGVLVEVGGDSMRAVSCDGRRLAVQLEKSDAFNEHLSENTCIVEPSTIKVLSKILSQNLFTIKSVNVSLEDSGKIYFAWNGGYIVSKLIDGRFPKWRSIIPSPTDKGRQEVVVQSGKLLQLVKQASVPKTDKQPGLTFKFEDGKLTLSARGSERGESKLTMDIAFDKDPISIKLEPRFVIDFLSVLDKEQIVHMFVMEGKGVLFQTEDNMQYVLMPMAS